ncbi:hypothetical protein J2X68_002669 [Streptomyces sp. 3330]|uniref:hypothetical protein n=1 Tax=Streptomyces sp. 3330 TaxID=2817755 RepID=UPI0028629B0E|nr:hypothetical protein [Streptomyces sp. 3330]MDR6975981.1 hypothetical protein [Streptomyces sp. 3330]
MDVQDGAEELHAVVGGPWERLAAGDGTTVAPTRAAPRPQHCSALPHMIWS